ncbi:Threonylcarbamoyl-AMP synthase [Smittium culicis]|uniref:Threonylcarbamoyl-AMP synthase n=1 Tax=Smittium culicis TaxID=133412 RepID=A0A1R1YTD2_9FUNG|nr:Threonylcarbamoyl-AMP synthase [Smittium culicis]
MSSRISLSYKKVPLLKKNFKISSALHPLLFKNRYSNKISLASYYSTHSNFKLQSNHTDFKNPKQTSSCKSMPEVKMSNLDTFKTITIPTTDDFVSFDPSIERSSIFINNVKINNYPSSSLKVPFVCNAKNENMIDVQNVSIVGKNSGWPDWLSFSVACILNDETIAIPTETVYGLAANALSEIAVRKIYLAKGRPSDNPLIVHVSSLEMLINLYKPDFESNSTSVSSSESESSQLLDIDIIPKIYHQLINSFWPGPLTIVLPKPKCIPKIILGNSEINSTVAFRLPSHPIARAIIECCGVPLAAPSANSSGLPSPTLASHVFKDLKGLIPLVVDSGSCEIGLESTVIDAISNKLPVKNINAIKNASLSEISGEKNHLDILNQIDKFNSFTDISNNNLMVKIPCILRPGGVSYEQITNMAKNSPDQPFRNDHVNLNPFTQNPSNQKNAYSLNLWSDIIVYGKNFSDSGIESAPTTPGMKYKHYSPKAKVSLFIPGEDSSLNCHTNPTCIIEGEYSQILTKQKMLDYILNLPSSFDNEISELSSSKNFPSEILVGLVCLASDAKWLDLPRSKFSVEVFDTSLPDHESAIESFEIERLSKSKNKTENVSTIVSRLDINARSATEILQTDSDSIKIKLLVFLVKSKPVLGSNMFYLLRLADDLGAREVIIEGVTDSDEGMAIMNRLKKASTNHIFS